MDQDIKLIIKEEISLLLTAGDKIVTKNEEISLVAGFLCKGNKSDYLSEKEIRLLLYNSFLKSSMSGKALRSRSGMSLDAW